jgi:hypothetical protein
MTDEDIILTPEERDNILRARKERQETLDRLEKRHRQHQIEHAYLEGTIWHTADGRKIPVAEMTPLHAQRSIRIARSMWNVHNIRYSGEYSDQVDMPNKPRLVALLEARAANKPTLRDKFKDRKSALKVAAKMAAS